MTRENEVRNKQQEESEKLMYLTLKTNKSKKKSQKKLENTQG